MYKLRTKPFAQHQTDAINWLAEREGGALLLPTGTGKTYVMLACMSIVDGPTLVVAPLSVVRGWASEIRLHTTASYTIATGRPAERRAALEADTDFVIINYDYFSRLAKNRGALLRRFPNVILDESTRIKNPRSKRTASIIRIFERAKRKYILTAKPITRDYGDVFSQWLFLDNGKTFGSNHFYFLKNYYSQIDFGQGRRGWEIKSGSSAKISARIAGTYFHRAKTSCLDLPPQIFERRYYSLGPDQRKVYEQVLGEWAAEFEGGERLVNNALARDTLLRQICSGYLGDGEGKVLRELETAKYETVRELVEDIGGMYQVVIWYNYRYELERLIRVFGKDYGSYTFVDGSISDSAERHRRLQLFENNNVRIFYAQLQTCAHGINELKRCEYAIYVGHTYDYDLRNQSEDRHSRKGSVASCTYIDVVGEKSIEEAILEVLSMKQHMTPQVFKENVYEILKRWA